MFNRSFAGQFDPVVIWLLKAITFAHFSQKVCLLSRRILATVHTPEPFT